MQFRLSARFPWTNFDMKLAIFIFFLISVTCYSKDIPSIFVICTSLLLHKLSHSYHFTSHSFWVSVWSFSLQVFTIVLRAITQTPFRITTTNVLHFTLRRRTVDSISERKTQRQIFWKAWLVYPRVNDSIHRLVYNTDD